MNIFDILGPIMVGPSSSHTAGVVRIGNVANKILGQTPNKIKVKFHGSFATTYIGHGSDKAIIGGLMGFAPDDERIRDSLTIAKNEGIHFSFETVSFVGVHPNTVAIYISGKNKGDVYIQAESIGGGNILIRKIDNVDVSFNGQYDAVIIHHSDTTGVVSLVTNVLSMERINIAKMEVYRACKGGEAIMIIETDGKLDKSLERTLMALPHIMKATVVSAI